MNLSGLHLLLTNQCNFECDHCFVWGSPRQSDTMTLRSIREILRQAENLGTIEWIYFEGGEPFLYYAILLRGVRMAQDLGFRVGIVSNAYWGTDTEDALEWLGPLEGLIQDLSLSSDLFHSAEPLGQEAKRACAAAAELDIPAGVIRIAQPEAANAASAAGRPPEGESALMYRGRAAEVLVSRAPGRAWQEFTECPVEDLREPGRVHVDPLGNLHLCQGISLGNLFQTPLAQICEAYDADSHPIFGPLLEGGPAELVRRYGVSHEESYADACHLCYRARHALRGRFTEILTPDSMYGVPGD
jgi:MoaA/NifB/PqqE/SkfB family radical SAM enzyme